MRVEGRSWLGEGRRRVEGREGIKEVWRGRGGIGKEKRGDCHGTEGVCAEGRRENV